MNLTLRPAGVDDLSALVELENRCFDYDRLSRRNFQWMLTRAHASLTVAEGDGGVLGYALVLFHEGTSLARLYSIAIDPRAHSRLVGCYMLFYAAGSGLGASADTAMYAWAGWDAVSLLGAAISLAALAFWWFTRGVGGEARTACANGA